MQCIQALVTGIAERRTLVKKFSSTGRKVSDYLDFTLETPKKGNILASFVISSNSFNNQDQGKDCPGCLCKQLDKNELNSTVNHSFNLSYLQ